MKWFLYSNELCHHGILGQKWGVRRYQNKDGSLTALGKERNKLSNSVYSTAAKKEPQITKDVMSSVESSGGKMYGLEHRLKTKRSIARKIHALSIEHGISYQEAARGLKDTIRYTSVNDDKNYVNGYFKTKASLESKGYKELRCINYFDMYNKGLAKHKAVQSIFQDPDGHMFELQFQTPASQEAKNKKVPLYEKIRTPGISDSERKHLEQQMVILAENVANPVGVEQIKSHDSITQDWTKI